MAYVYIYFDPRSTPMEPIYIGKGRGNRMYYHLFQCKNSILRRKIENIRAVGLEPVVLKFKDGLTDEAAIKLEAKLIAKYGRLSNKTGTLANFTDGGEGTAGYTHKKKTIKLFSQMRKGKKQTPAQLKANRSRKPSMETRKKISDSNKGIDRLSPEKRKQIAEKLKGRKQSDETRALQSLQRRGKKQTPAQYTANCNRVKRTKEVVCINNGKVYISPDEAARDLNLKKSSVTSVANGAKASVKGFKFKYTGKIIKSDNHPSSSTDQNLPQ